MAFSLEMAFAGIDGNSGHTNSNKHQHFKLASGKPGLRTSQNLYSSTSIGHSAKGKHKQKLQKTSFWKYETSFIN